MTCTRKGRSTGNKLLIRVSLERDRKGQTLRRGPTHFSQRGWKINSPKLHQDERGNKVATGTPTRTTNCVVQSIETITCAIWVCVYRPRDGCCVRQGFWHSIPRVMRHVHFQGYPTCHKLNNIHFFFRCVLRKIAKSDYLIRHVCPSVRMKQLGSHWTDFH